MIADDDYMVLNSLEVLFSADPELEIVGRAQDGLEAIALCGKIRPDLVLMDIRMPKMDGINACREIKKQFPPIKVLMLTTFDDYQNIYRSLQAGASGYLLKSDSLEKQLMTIKAVYNGLPIISADALKSFSESQASKVLTPRENEIHELVANGYANREIAAQMHISEGTVRNTISQMLDKLQLRDRTQLAICYWQMKSGLSEDGG